MIYCKRAQGNYIILARLLLGLRYFLFYEFGYPKLQTVAPILDSERRSCPLKRKRVGLGQRLFRPNGKGLWRATRSLGLKFKTFGPTRAGREESKEAKIRWTNEYVTKGNQNQELCRSLFIFIPKIREIHKGSDKKKPCKFLNCLLFC